MVKKFNEDQMRGGAKVPPGRPEVARNVSGDIRDDAAGKAEDARPTEARWRQWCKDYPWWQAAYGHSYKEWLAEYDRWCEDWDTTPHVEAWETYVNVMESERQSPLDRIRKLEWLVEKLSERLEKKIEAATKGVDFLEEDVERLGERVNALEKAI